MFYICNTKIVKPAKSSGKSRIDHERDHPRKHRLHGLHPRRGCLPSFGPLLRRHPQPAARRGHRNDGRHREPCGGNLPRTGLIAHARHLARGGSRHDGPDGFTGRLRRATHPDRRHRQSCRETPLPLAQQPFDCRHLRRPGRLLRPEGLQRPPGPVATDPLRGTLALGLHHPLADRAPGAQPSNALNHG